MPALTTVLKEFAFNENSFKIDVNNNKFDLIGLKEKNNRTTNLENEIFDQSNSLRRLLNKRVNFGKKEIIFNEISEFAIDILRCRRIIIIGVGSSYNVAISVRQILEELVELPVFVELASDFLDREVPVFRDDVCIFLSQSGETGTIIEACRYCKERDALALAVTNDTKSLLSRNVDFTIDIHANQEVAIASTKTYSNQFLTMVLLSLYLSSDKKTLLKRREEIIDGLKSLPEKVDQVLKKSASIKNITSKLDNTNSILVMGRGYQRGTCREGSLKFKEVAHVHSEGIHSGELKHGPLALIDDKIPIVMIIMRDAIYDKCINALQQVLARNGNPILICEENDLETETMVNEFIEIPKTLDCLSGLLTVIPFQLMSLHFALQLGIDVDDHQSLTKTVFDKI